MREREERLRLFLGNATDYAFIITDPEGARPRLARAGAERITGWRADEIIGKPASVLFTAEDRAAGAAEAEMAEAARDRAGRGPALAREDRTARGSSPTASWSASAGPAGSSAASARSSGT